jgi:hypothetical protein
MFELREICSIYMRISFNTANWHSCPWMLIDCSIYALRVGWVQHETHPLQGPREGCLMLGHFGAVPLPCFQRSQLSSTFSAWGALRPCTFRPAALLCPSFVGRTALSGPVSRVRDSHNQPPVRFRHPRRPSVGRETTFPHRYRPLFSVAGLTPQPGANTRPPATQTSRSDNYANGSSPY